MLASPGLSSYGFKYDNWPATPAATAGTSVVPGASNAEGAWTQIAAAANITADCHWLFIHVHTGATSTAQKDHLLDIGIDPAGGTAYVAAISNIVCGESQTLSNGGTRPFIFPLFIRSGSSVAVRIQGNAATAGTVRVMAKFYGRPTLPEIMPIGQFAETIGAITNSGGQSFTPGNAADGAWQSLGVTAKDLWWWQLGYQISAATITGEMTYIELAYGDATNKISIMRHFHLGSTGETCLDVAYGNLSFVDCYCPVPAGSTIYIRGRCDTAPDTGYNAVAIGIGG